MMKKLYAALAVAGFVLPMSQLALFVRDHGFDLRTLAAQAFANASASMFAFDLIVSCAVFWAFVFTTRVRRRWAYVVMTLGVGLSFALPMFLLARASEHFGATLPLTSDERRGTAAPARPASPVR